MNGELRRKKKKASSRGGPSLQEGAPSRRRLLIIWVKKADLGCLNWGGKEHERNAAKGSDQSVLCNSSKLEKRLRANRQRDSDTTIDIGQNLTSSTPLR